MGLGFGLKVSHRFMALVRTKLIIGLKVSHRVLVLVRTKLNDVRGHNFS